MSEVIADETTYIAPRIEDCPRRGRKRHTAACGHKVWLDERGVTAVYAEGKRLVCEPCCAAWCAERGGELRTYAHGVWDVSYPSGKRLQVTGGLDVVLIGDLVQPIIEEGERVVLLDQRAIVSEHKSGRVVYRPSMVPRERLKPEFRLWLDEHPEWDAAR
jgi:hypothetical protein